MESIHKIVKGNITWHKLNITNQLNPKQFSNMQFSKNCLKIIKKNKIRNVKWVKKKLKMLII
jgi:hypothetical protein